MKYFFKILKTMGWIILSLLLILVVGTIIVVTTFPVFGGKASREEINSYALQENYKDGKFVNQIPTSMNMNFSTTKELLGQYMRGIPQHRPEDEFPVHSIDSTWLAEDPGKDYFIWFGHSAFLANINGKRILLDPMLGTAAAPFQWMGPKRFQSKLPIDPNQLPEIDIVVLSHDHYDHLDYPTILQLKDRTQLFLVPLGVDAHLKKWGIPSSKIKVFNWYEGRTFYGIRMICTPSRHFSGRGIADREKTLWASWVIQTPLVNLYFSGDSGYGPHFKEIGEKYGPFDFAMLECGQYDPKWHAIHMMPEETAQAALDLGAKKMMPIHWGSFALALHAWNDPVKRVTSAAENLNIPVVIPEIGQAIAPWDSTQSVKSDWWRTLK
jgi:L-ascorbate metabolism protein UlaG (beta-lactamase superfamily)